MLMGMNGLPACMCLDYVCRAHGGQCRVLGPLELDLQMVLSHRVVAENPNPGCLPEQQVLWITVISQAPPNKLFQALKLGVSGEGDEFFG